MILILNLIHDTCEYVPTISDSISLNKSNNNEFNLLPIFYQNLANGISTEKQV